MPVRFADRIGPLNTSIPMSLITTFLAFIWIFISTPAALILFCVLYGFVSGAFLSLTLTVTRGALFNIGYDRSETGHEYCWYGGRVASWEPYCRFAGGAQWVVFADVSWGKFGGGDSVYL